MRLMGKAEIEFGKLGFLKKHRGSVITYYRPYTKDEIKVDDISFIIALKKIVFYQGTEMGSDAYRLDYKILHAIETQCEELGWNKEKKGE